MSIATIFNSQTKTTFAAASLLGITMLGSRLLGLFRDRILAGKYGAGDELDMYYAAFQIPDFLYMILIIGAVSTAFLPVFTEYFHRDQKEAWKLANQVLNLFLFSLILGGIILALISPWLVHLIAPGFEGEKYTTTVRLTQIMFISPVLFGISNIVGVILQFSRRFLIYSIAPLLYNIGIIIGVLFFTPLWGIYGLAYGVILGAGLHMAVQLPVAFWCGFRFYPTLSFFSRGVKEILVMMVPRSLGLAVSQASIIVSGALASLVSSGGISVLHLANNLQHLAISIFGISFAVASFPLLSRFHVEGEKEAFLREFLKTFRTISFFVVPAASIFFLLRAHIVRVILGSGNFSWIDTRLTAGALGMFAAGIVFFSLIPLLTRTFFAQRNTKTPVILNIIGTVLGLVFAAGALLWLETEGGAAEEALFVFLDLEGVPGREIIALPLGVSLGAMINFLTLSIALLKNHPDILKNIIRYICIIGGISLTAGFAGWGALRFTLRWFDLSTFWSIFGHGALGGFVVILWYGLWAYLLRIEEIKEVRHLLTKAFKRS